MPAAVHIKNPTQIKAVGIFAGDGAQRWVMVKVRKPVSSNGKVNRQMTLPSNLTDTGIVTVALGRDL
jgi:hypothetical protein